MELEHLEMLVQLAPVVSLVSVVKEDRLGQMVEMVNVDHQDRLGHWVSLASWVLRGPVDNKVSVEVQACKDSLDPLVPQDSRAFWDE